MSSRILRSTAVALAVTAISAPAASARPVGETHPIGIESPPVITTVDDGFDWGSAGLGAGTAGAIVLLSLAGVSLKGRMHVRSVS